MKSMPSLLIKIGVFAAVMAVILVGVLRTIEKPIRGDVTGYTALFTDANGLRVGNDIREFGVSVGKVTGISLKGNDAKVTFVEAPWGTVVDPQAVEDAVKRVKPRLVACVHGDTSTSA